jgi:NADPH:quinone reductase-like Zn-dependent oxidoreductase
VTFHADDYPRAEHGYRSTIEGDSMMTKTMMAYHLDKLGTIDDLSLRRDSIPRPGPRQVLVRVQAASLNRRDFMVMQGKYVMPTRLGVVPLSDGAGEVVAVGEEVTRARVGDRVTATYFPGWVDGELTPERAGDQYGCVRDGALAEYWLLEDEVVVQLPAHLSFQEGATLTCAGVTAFAALTGPRSVLPGETVLTLGSGGVSLFTIQFAKMLGARVIATTSDPAKTERLRALGADHVVEYGSKPDWESSVRDLTGGRGVDHVIETVGPATLQRSILATRYGGQVVLAGAFGEQPIDGMSLLLSNVTITPVLVGSRSTFEAMNRAIAQHELRPVINQVFPFDQAKQAYHYLDAQRQIGKVVISAAA